MRTESQTEQWESYNDWSQWPDEHPDRVAHRLVAVEGEADDLADEVDDEGEFSAEELAVHLLEP